jgi:hypothetical protein
MADRNVADRHAADRNVADRNFSVAGFPGGGEVRHAFGRVARDFTWEEGHVVVGTYRGIHDRVYPDRADDTPDAHRAHRAQDRADTADAHRANRSGDGAQWATDAAVAPDAVGVERIANVRPRGRSHRTHRHSRYSQHGECQLLHVELRSSARVL